MGSKAPPLRRLTQAEYEDGDVFATITHDDDTLVDITSFVDGAPIAIDPGAKGWYLEMVAGGGTGTGEKVLAEARTIANMIQFPTWEPPAEDAEGPEDDAPCHQQPYGTNRLYTVSAFNGAPVIEQDSEAGMMAGDRSRELQQSGIAPEVVWLFPSAANPEDCEGDECRPPPRCLVGIEACGINVNLAPVRTFWKQNSVN